MVFSQAKTGSSAQRLGTFGHCRLARVLLASWLDFIGLMYISASLERIILFLYPTLTVLASSLIYKQPLRLKAYIAILLSYGGTVIVMLQEQNHAPMQSNFWLGASLVFASAVAFACYLLLTSIN
jgi:drug/metabolite transporter (DMT)-like permease